MKFWKLNINTIFSVMTVSHAFKCHTPVALSRSVTHHKMSMQISNKINSAVAGTLLTLITSTIPVFAYDNTITSSPSVVNSLLIADADTKKSSIVKLPSGVEYFDAVIGDGDEVVKEGSSVQFQWVLRRSNGYFVDASSNYGDEPFIYKVGNTKKVIKGLDEAIRGMKVNGIRKMNIPPNVAFVEGVGDGKPGPMPSGFGPRRQILTRLDREVWFFEIKLTKLKNSD